MVELEQYQGQEPAWCPGCGNFALLKTWKQAMVELGLEPHQLVVVSGIGQAAKLPHYTQCNTFNGLHGRTLPVATAIRMVNHGIPVIAETGDGDCYGEGGNHFLHAMRRNINVKLFVHDNQVYGLTKGQASPTSGRDMTTIAQPFGVLPEEMNPVALAVAMNASFVARGSTSDTAQLKELMKAAMEHRGFALIDIFQPCVVYNKINTLKWYREHCQPMDDAHDPTDREAAFHKALEFGEHIPTGIIYRNDRPLYEEISPVIAGKDPLVRQPFRPDELAKEIDKYY